MDIIVYKYEDWREFKDAILKELFGLSSFVKGKYIFRGQASADWSLKPSFDRVFDFLPSGKKNEVMNELLKNFKYECELMGVSEEVLNSEIKMMSLGQHYGLPTRLLDWTESPYIAAFFAFSDPAIVEFSEYVTVWVLNMGHEEVWDEGSGVKIMKVPFIDNVRIRNQYGLFTYMKTPFSCLEEYVGHFSGTGSPLIKCMINARESKDALSDLDAMGINYTRLFQDLNGAAFSAKNRVLINYKII